MTRVLKNRIISLFNEGKTYSEIAAILRCSKGTISYHCSHLIEPDHKYSKESIKKYQEYYDKGHTLKDTALLFKVSPQFLSRKLIVRRNSILDKKDYALRKKQYRERVKQQCVDYKGGKCSICGYNKCVQALDFHHLSPLEKDFTISGGTKNFESLKKELDKCILVCKNCHSEIHQGLHLN